MPQMAVMAGLTGLSALTGALNNRKAARTSTATQKTTKKESTKVRRTLLPHQEGLIDPLAETALTKMTNPGAALEPLRGYARQSVNDNFAGAQEAISQKFLTGGGAKSGKFGRAVRGVETARAGALSDMDAQFAQMVLQQQEQGTSLAERLLGMNFGQDINSEGESFMEGTSVGPGSALGGAFSGGLGTLGTLLMMNKLLKGSGGGGYPS